MPAGAFCTVSMDAAVMTLYKLHDRNTGMPINDFHLHSTASFKMQHIFRIKRRKSFFFFPLHDEIFSLSFSGCTLVLFRRHICVI